MILPRRLPSQWRSRGAVLCACAAAGVAAALLRRGALEAVAWALQAGIAVALARVGRHAPVPGAAAAGPAGTNPGLERLGRVMAWCGAAVVLAVSLAAMASWQRWAVLAMLAFPPGLAVAALGLDLAEGRAPWWRDLGAAIRRHAGRPEAWALAAIVLAGAAFRLATFGDFPPPDGFPTIEESQGAGIATVILGQGYRPWGFASSHYLSAVVFAVTGPGMTALRLPAILMGCLTVPVFYLLARAFVGVPAALLATALLAVSRWHVETSWFNDNNFTPLLMFAAGLVLLLRSGPGRRPSLAVGAAALAGMSFFEYVTFRPLLVIAAAVVAARLAAGWRDRVSRAHAAAFGATLLLFVPIAIGAVRSSDPWQFFEPFMRNAADREYYTPNAADFVRLRVERLGAAAQGFTVTDHQTFFGTLNTDQEPLLDPATGVLFWVGLGLVALRPRRRGHALILGGFVLLLVGCTVVTQNYDIRRLAVLVPFAFLFVALACETALGLAESARGRRLALAVLLAVVASAAAWNADFLFRRLARSHYARAGYRDDYTTATFLLRREWRGERALLVTPEDDFYPFNFFDPTDYTWLLPPGIEGRVEPSLDCALAEAAGATAPLLLVAQRPFPLEEFVGEVLRRAPTAACGFGSDPDDWRLDVAFCRVGAGAGPPGLLPEPDPASGGRR